MSRSVFKEGGLPDGAELTYINRGKQLLSGYKEGSRIYCCCCHEKVSPSTFEAHAGWSTRRKPYENIFLSNGVSLHQFPSSNSDSNYIVKKIDHFCNVCCKGEEQKKLIYCSGCPRSFHEGCLCGQAREVDETRRWFCKYCNKSIKSLEQDGNSVAATSVSGIDPLGQIAMHGINKIGNTDNSGLVACVLCRSCDFSESDFNDQTVIVCDQCEKEFHIGCLRQHNKVDLKALPEGKWFCCVECVQIHCVIEKLLALEPADIPDSLMGLVGTKHEDNAVDNTTMKWNLLNGKNAPDNSKYLLTEAVDIFNECFNPIIDEVTGCDFVPSMLYGRQMGNLDFQGMHCAMLTIDSKVVTVGLFRVLGSEVAEFPLVATAKTYQGKGYFQLFFACFERLLSFLKVKKIVLPAAHDAKPLWTNKMGFHEVNPLQLTEYRKTWTSMVTFKETTLLEKKVSQREG